MTRHKGEIDALLGRKPSPKGCNIAEYVYYYNKGNRRITGDVYMEECAFIALLEGVKA